MRIAFLGTGDVALPSFEFLLRHPPVELVGLVTQPDRPAGRGNALTAPKIKTRALAAGTPVHQPEKIRRASALAPIEAWRVDVLVTMAYGQILPKALLEMPRLACLNLHASLLPRHRGAAPIQAAIREGDETSGITVMYMAEGLDTGDILLQRPLFLHPEETGQTLHDRLAELAPAALEEALGLLAIGQAPRVPQANELATHAGQLHRQDGLLDWSRPAPQLERLIRAYHPWPGTHTRLPGQPPRLLKIFPPVEAIEGVGEPGTVLALHADAFDVATGQGALRVRRVQGEGRKLMSSREFLAGARLREGDRLSG